MIFGAGCNSLPVVQPTTRSMRWKRCNSVADGIVRMVEGLLFVDLPGGYSIPSGLFFGGKREKESTMSHTKLKRLIVLGLFAAIAFVATMFLRIPMISFLKYDPKDIIIIISGFIYGPLASLAVIVSVSVVEFFTISDTGLWGLLMNIISSSSIVLPAVLIYQKDRSLRGAIIGLSFGCVLNVVSMLLWNYVFTPFYLGQPRDAIAAMLLPVFLPFNLFKSTINALVTFLLYKPISKALVSSHLLEKTVTTNHNGRFKLVPVIAALLLLVVVLITVLYSILG